MSAVSGLNGLSGLSAIGPELWLLAFGCCVAGLVLALASPERAAYAGRVSRYARWTAPVSASIGPSRLPRPVELFLARAGVNWTPGKALAIAFAHLTIGGLIGSFMHMAIPGMLIGGGVLFLKLRIGQTKRLRKLEAQLPEALMLMASAIRSGLGFQQAIALVAEEGPQPIAEEMQHFGNDLAMGLTTAEALARLQARFDSTDAEMLASALMIQHETGGNLTEILTNLHHTIRERQQLLGQVRTLTAQGRLSGVILTLLPFAIGAAFYLLNRDYLMTLVIDPRGRILLGGAIFSTIVGALFIRRIVDIRL